MPDRSDELSRNGPTHLGPASFIARLAVIYLVVSGIAGLFAYAGGWLTPHALTPSRMIDTFEQVNGPHPGFRRNHAKGVGFSGYFDGNGQGVALSKASVFARGRVAVIGRFALAGGSRTRRMRRKRCAAWPSISNCQTEKSGGRE